MGSLDKKLADILPLYTEMKGIHPAANAWPMPTDEEYQLLVNGINDVGLLEPIKFEKGTFLLIDGRSRLMACHDAQVEPRFVSTTLDPWVVAMESGNRRNLSTGQKAMAGRQFKAHFADEAKVRQSEAGGDRKSDNKKIASGNIATSDHGQARDKAASKVGVGGKAIDKACFIADESKEIKDQVSSGEITLEAGFKDAKKHEKERKKGKESKPSPSQPMTPIITPEGKTVTIHLPKSVVFNKTNENVDWAGYTWNPVTGCRHGCKFCYADGISKMERMKKHYPLGFEPTFHEYRLDAPKNTKPDGRVFVCSMADLFGKWVPDEWIKKVFDAAMQSPEWEYLFLTKWPNRYKMLTGLPHAWFGASIIKQSDVARVTREMQSFDTSGIKWISLEPMLEPIVFDDLNWCDLVVIGSQTAANGEPAIAPDFEWVADVVSQCREFGVKVYLKPNLMDIAPGMAMPKELP